MLSLKTNASLISISLKRQNQNETMRIKATDNNEGKKKKKKRGTQGGYENKTPSKRKKRNANYEAYRKNYRKIQVKPQN